MRNLGFKYTHLANIFNIFELFPKTAFRSSQFCSSFWVSKARVSHTHTCPHQDAGWLQVRKRERGCAFGIYKVYFFHFFPLCFCESPVLLWCRCLSQGADRFRWRATVAPVLPQWCVSPLSLHTPHSEKSTVSWVLIAGEKLLIVSPHSWASASTLVRVVGGL